MKLDSAVFYSSDLGTVTDFYIKKLKFKLEYKDGERYLSFIFDGGGRLGVKKFSEEREKPGMQTVFIGVDNIERVYDDVKKEGIAIRKELNLLPGFGKNFSILDPDGNKVQFVQRENT